MGCRAIILGVLVLACSDGGGGDGGGAAGGSAPAPADRCRANCEAFARCEGFSLSGCVGDIHCDGWPASGWRAEVAAAFQRCTESCPADPMTCITAARTAAGAARPMDTEFGTECTAKRTVCNSGVNDFCAEAVLYSESSVTAGRACLSEPCSSVKTCLDGVFED